MKLTSGISKSTSIRIQEHSETPILIMNIWRPPTLKMYHMKTGGEIKEFGACKVNTG